MLDVIHEKIKLNKAQQQCVENLEGFILVLSGAGTGKTRVIIHRFLSLIQNGLHYSKILCLTFSNRAANEIIERLEDRLEEKKSLWVGTFHSICFRLLQIYGDLDQNISIIDEYDQKKIVEMLHIEENLREIQLYKEMMLKNPSETFFKSYNIYQNYLEENNYLDFGEIILKTLEMLENNKEILEKIQEKFEYIMVDEYQDTSKLQDKLIKILSNKNLFCVGDDDQSIYSWRGACIDNILNFPKNYNNVKIFRLEQNYRCTQNILSIANHIIGQNKIRMQKQVWSEKTGSEVIIFSTKNEEEILAKEILKIPLSENIGILVRSSFLVKNIETSLIKYNIKYKIVGGVRFFEKMEIKTAMSYLKAIFFEDYLSIERILKFPKKGIGAIKINKILNLMKEGLNFVKALMEIGQISFAERFLYWQSIKNKDPYFVLKTIWEESGCEDIFEDKNNNIDILLEKVKSFSTIDVFLENFFSLDEERTERVTIMTIHSSKGLEFDNVFIPGFVEGVFPNSRTLSEGNIDEERRLAYVAVTRAKNKLFLLYNLSNIVNKNLFGPSRFLFNLPKSNVKFFNI